MVFVRTAEQGKELFNHVMDLSSLDIGQEHYKGTPVTPVPDDPILVTDFTAAR